MEPPVLSPSAPSSVLPFPRPQGFAPKGGRWRWVVLVFLALMMVGAWTVYQSFRSGGETRLVRQTILEEDPGGWSRQVEFGIGRLPVAAIQMVLGFVPMDPAARTAVASLRRADVAVYERLPGAKKGDNAAMVWRAREALSRRGWEPVVAVGEAHESVLVLMPAREATLRRFQVCVMVLDDERLVIASIGANLEPLMNQVDVGDLLRRSRAL
jgi:hypothetical protein